MEAILPGKQGMSQRAKAPSDSGERTRLACWLRRLAATDFLARPVTRGKVRDGEGAIASTRGACAPRSFHGRAEARPSGTRKPSANAKDFFPLFALCRSRCCGRFWVVSCSKSEAKKTINFGLPDHRFPPHLVDTSERHPSILLLPAIHKLLAGSFTENRTLSSTRSP